MSTQPNYSIEKSLNTAFGFLRWVGVIVVVALLFSGVTFVQPDEVALILRFGKLVGDTPAEQIHQPGLLMAFPYLVDQVVRVPVRKVQEVTIDGLFSGDEIRSILSSGYAITGDQNLVLLHALARYQITDPVQYALKVENPNLLIKEIITSALTGTIAGLNVDTVLAEGKKELALMVIKEAQERADEIGIGVQLVALEFNTLKPPAEVKREFDQVTSAYVMKETMIQEAQRYREERLPNATADRNAMIRKAESFKLERTAQAKTDVAQFLALVDEYEKNPDLVRERLYREKVEAIMSKAGDQIFLPAGDATNKVILPYDPDYRRDEVWR